MNIYTFLYLADKVDSFSLFFSTIGVIGGALFTLVTIGALLDTAIRPPLKRLSILATVACYISLVIGGLIPSKDFMYQAGAVYLGKQVVKNEQVQETFNKVKKVIDLNLDKQIKELNGDKADGTQGIIRTR